ncbi:hypothetical protein N9Y42_09555 [Mariniblastus sp.]|nr:hypothetical protein [Mariniblastus sp.]
MKQQIPPSDIDEPLHIFLSQLPEPWNYLKWLADQPLEHREIFLKLAEVDSDVPEGKTFLKELFSSRAQQQPVETQNWWLELTEEAQRYQAPGGIIPLAILEGLASHDLKFAFDHYANLYGAGGIKTTDRLADAFIPEFEAMGAEKTLRWITTIEVRSNEEQPEERSTESRLITVKESCESIVSISALAVELFYAKNPMLVEQWLRGSGTDVEAFNWGKLKKGDGDLFAAMATVQPARTRKFWEELYAEVSEEESKSESSHFTDADVTNVWSSVVCGSGKVAHHETRDWLLRTKKLVPYWFQRVDGIRSIAKHWPSDELSDAMPWAAANLDVGEHDESYYLAVFMEGLIGVWPLENRVEALLALSDPPGGGPITLLFTEATGELGEYRASDLVKRLSKYSTRDKTDLHEAAWKAIGLRLCYSHPVSLYHRGFGFSKNDSKQATLTHDQTADKLEKWLTSAVPAEYAVKVRTHLIEYWIRDEEMGRLNAWIRNFAADDPLRRKMIQVILYREGRRSNAEEMFFPLLTEGLSESETQIALDAINDGGADEEDAYDREDFEPDRWFGKRVPSF